MIRKGQLRRWKNPEVPWHFDRTFLVLGPTVISWEGMRVMHVWEYLLDGAVTVETVEYIEDNSEVISEAR